jgi:hypothetical protein
MIRKNHANIGVLTDEVITGLSAIVGNNGSGKTTIIDHIFHTSLIKTKDLGIENEQIRFEIETIQIYVNKSATDEKINVFFNLPCRIKYDLENLRGDEIVEYDINELNKDYYSETRSDNSHPNSISKVFLTNSSQKSKYSHEDGDGQEHNISLNPKTIENLSRTFYSSKTQIFLGVGVNNLFNNFQKFMIRSRSMETFQSLCDVCYYNNLRKANKDSFVKKNNYIKLSVTSILNNSKDFLTEFSQKPLGVDANWETTIKKEIQNIILYSPQEKWGFIEPDQIEDSFTKIGHFKNRYDKTNIILQLILNLIFELRCCGFMSENDIETLMGINEIDKIKTTIKKFVEKYEKKILKAYYKSAIDEIEELEIILKECSCVADNLGYIKFDCNPKNDFEEDKLEKPWIKIYEYIENYTRAKRFFVLKYLNITIEHMSSGERALLNFFSWLHIVPFFDSIKGFENGRINNNVLILIDEIDLYCHPEWQRQFINILMNELKVEFRERKVQVVFTTHSPIILSDIPDDNVVYLENAHVVNRFEKTFAQNIYTLYNDAFFLRETIGECSKKIIVEVDENLKRHEIKLNENNFRMNFYEDDTMQYCKKITAIIGEPIIRKSFERRIKKIEQNYRSVNLKELIILFDSLEKTERMEMIQYIIETSEE